MEKGGTTPEQWQRSVSAPGTEAFKQDFAKWESLKKNLLVALDQTESQLSDQLRARENRERLNAGRHDAVADTYRALVDRYYQSLAAPRAGRPESVDEIRRRSSVVGLRPRRSAPRSRSAGSPTRACRSSSRRAAASALSALRALTLILLIVILLRPVVMVPPAAANNSLLPILVDVSRSMRLSDAGRRRPAHRARAGDRARSAGAARRANTGSSF